MLWDGEMVKEDRSMSSSLCTIERLADKGVVYDSLPSSVVCVDAEESSVTVSSQVSWVDGCSSYPDKETLALDSKNCFQNFEPSQTLRECSAYCSTIGRMLEVTIRWARLKLWSISWRVRVMDCSSFSSSSVNVKEELEG